MDQGSEDLPAFVLEADELGFVARIAVPVFQKADQKPGIVHQGIPAGDPVLPTFPPGEGILPEAVVIQRLIHVPDPAGLHQGLHGNHHVFAHVRHRRGDALAQGPADHSADQAPPLLALEHAAYGSAFPPDQLTHAPLLLHGDIARDDIQVLRLRFPVQGGVGVDIDIIVTVAVDDILAPGEGDPLHPDGRLAAVARHPEDGHLVLPRREFRQDLAHHVDGPVLRAVVDEEELDVVQGLPEQRAGASGHVGLDLVDRYDDTDRGHGRKIATVQRYE